MTTYQPTFSNGLNSKKQLPTSKFLGEMKEPSTARAEGNDHSIECILHDHSGRREEACALGSTDTSLQQLAGGFEH